MLQRLPRLPAQLSQQLQVHGHQPGPNMDTTRSMTICRQLDAHKGQMMSRAADVLMTTLWPGSTPDYDSMLESTVQAQPGSPAQDFVYSGAHLQMSQTGHEQGIHRICASTMNPNQLAAWHICKPRKALHPTGS